MSVAVETVSNTYVADGVTTVFPFTFEVLTAADVRVALHNIATATTEFANPSGYTVVVNGNLAGGSVTFNTAPATGFRVIVVRQLPFTQPITLSNQTRYFPTVAEEAYDRLCMQIQLLKEEVDRKVGVPLGSPLPASYQTFVEILNDASSAADEAAASAAEAEAQADRVTALAQAPMRGVLAGQGNPWLTLPVAPWSPEMLTVFLDGVAQAPATWRLDGAVLIREGGVWPTGAQVHWVLARPLRDLSETGSYQMLTFASEGEFLAATIAEAVSYIGVARQGDATTELVFYMRLPGANGAEDLQHPGGSDWAKVSISQADLTRLAETIYENVAPNLFGSRALASAAYIPTSVLRFGIYSQPAGSADLQTIYYVESPTSTNAALTTNGGARYWMPDGHATPNHWGENTIPGTTNMQAAIKAAADWCQSRSQTLYFLDELYRVNSTLSFSTGNHTWTSDRAGNQAIKLQFAGPLSSRILDFSPVSPLLSTTQPLSNFTFRGLVFQRIGANATAEGVVFTKCQGIQIDECASWGNWRNWSFIGCRNVHTTRLGGSSGGVYLTGPAGSANVHISSFNHSDNATAWLNYTHDFNECLISSIAYDATFLFEDVDYVTISNSYLGQSKIRVLVKPDRATARVVNVELNNTYLDGGPWPDPPAECHIKIDNAAGAKVNYIRQTGGIIAQCDRGLVIVNGAEVQNVVLQGVDIHNTERNVVQSVGSAPDLLLSILGCTITNWARGATATGQERDAILLDNFKMFHMQDCSGAAWEGETEPVVEVGSGTDMKLLNNTFDRVTVPVTITGAVTRRIERNNTAGSVLWPDFDYRQFNTLPNPQLKFGGTELVAGGGTYGSRLMQWERLGSFVRVQGFISITSKGTATGTLTVTLPVAPIANNSFALGTCFVSGMTSDAEVPSYALYLPSNSSELEIRKNTPTGFTSAGRLTDAEVGAFFNMHYNIIYRVA